VGKCVNNLGDWYYTSFAQKESDAYPLGKKSPHVILRISKVLLEDGEYFAFSSGMEVKLYKDVAVSDIEWKWRKGHKKDQKWHSLQDDTPA
jgi:hypothetical protein